ncbi:MAG: deoxyribonuclease IV [Chloroflexi bacterium]|nr:deoxyribonuclease IV [Chloroflexota bacterium]
MSTADPAPDAAAAHAVLGGRRIGAHLPIRHGLAAVSARARELGSGVVQVFTDDPRGWAPRAEPHADLDALRTDLERSDVTLVVHASYLVNLAGPDGASRARAVERMQREMVAAEAFGARVVTVHVGSHKGAGQELGIERAGESVARILDGLSVRPDAPRLALEDSAGQGDAVGVTIAELADILAAAERHGADPDRVGICLDTAHLWGAGVALDDPAVVETLLTEVETRVGRHRLLLLHLNDSASPLGSRTDRHQHIGDGAIGRAALGHLLRHPRLPDVPIVLETPAVDTDWGVVDLARARGLLTGQDADVVDEPAPRYDPGGARAHRTICPPHDP